MTVGTALSVLLLSLGLVAPSEAALCSDYVLDLCDPLLGEVITRVSTNDKETCQKMCRIYSSTCQMWIFDSQLPESERCTLMSADPYTYISTCMEIAGPLTPNVTTCLSELNLNECSFFTEGRCFYPNNVLETLPGITEGPGDGNNGCDDACRLNEDMGCVYWRYRYEEQDCVLYGSDDKSCNIERGTQYPDIGQCENECPCTDPLICVSNKCEVCNPITNEGCETGYVCETENGANVCKPACGECPPDKPFCDLFTLECRECLKDSDCKNPDEPICDIGDTWTCVECVQDSDCSNGLVCDDSSNQCVVCVDNDDCPSNLPVCDTSVPVCRECVNNGDCTDPNLPVCDTGDSWTCVECNQDSDCGNGLVCDEPNNQCTVCVDNDDCPSNLPVCDTSVPVCRECVENADCKDSSLPVCDTGDSWTCVECTQDSDCGNGLVCDETINQCTVCVDNDDCPSNLPVCDTSVPVCRECVNNGDCTDPDLPVCDTGDSWTCVECSQDSDCSTGVCDETTNKCEVCVDNEDCPANLPVCDTSVPVCRECVTNSDCKDPDLPICDVGDSWTCVECTQDSDCGSGLVCDEPNNECTVCVGNEDCPANLPICDASVPVCRECVTNSDCTNPDLPVCDIGDSWTCVECTRDSDCGSGLVCDEPNNECTVCVDNQDCPSNLPICDTSVPVCRECVTNGDCNDPDLPVCDIGDSWTCVECTRDSDCGSGFVCDESNNQCTVCVTDSDCPSNLPVCDTSVPVCRECVDNGDCTSSSLPACDIGDSWTCVECTKDSDCGSGLVCDETINQCTVCVDNEDCPSNLPVCDTSVPVCRECVDNSDCTSSSLPVCDSGDSWTCVECTQDSDCGSGLVCDEPNNQCTVCVNNSDCPSNLPVCDTSVPVCRECMENDDCTNPDLPACNTDSWTCVECTTTADCNFGEVCDTSVNECKECIVDGDCQEPHPICWDNVCIGCRSDSDCDCDVTGVDDCNPYTLNQACSWCNTTSQECVGGCQEEQNCVDTCGSGYFCTTYGDHTCEGRGSTTTLEKMTIETTSCNGCDVSQEGVIITATYKADTCTTERLDNTTRIDYSTGSSAEFTKYEHLSECTGKSMGAGPNLEKVQVTYLGTGTWTLGKVRVDYSCDCYPKCCMGNGSGFMTGQTREIMCDDC